MNQNISNSSSHLSSLGNALQGKQAWSKPAIENMFPVDRTALGLGKGNVATEFSADRGPASGAGS